MIGLWVAIEDYMQVEHYDAQRTLDALLVRGSAVAGLGREVRPGPHQTGPIRIDWYLGNNDIYPHRHFA